MHIFAADRARSFHVRIFWKAHQVGEEPERSGYDFGQLAIERIGVIDVNTFPVSGVE